MAITSPNLGLDVAALRRKHDTLGRILRTARAHATPHAGCKLVFLRAPRSKRRTGTRRRGHQPAPCQHLPALLLRREFIARSPQYYRAAALFRCRLLQLNVDYGATFKRGACLRRLVVNALRNRMEL